MAKLTGAALAALELLDTHDSAFVFEEQYFSQVKDIRWNGGRQALDYSVFLRLVKRELISRASPTRWQINDAGRAALAVATKPAVQNLTAAVEADRDHWQQRALAAEKAVNGIDMLSPLEALTRLYELKRALAANTEAHE